MNDCCGSPVSSASLTLIVKTMADKILDNTQLVSGAAILLAFFAGYKYAQRSLCVQENSAEKKERGAVASGSGETAPIVTS